MDGGTISGATVSSLVNVTLRISQVVYELKAVGEQTRDLLDSTRHVSSTLQAARNLRHKKSQHLDATEKKWIDDVLVNTDKTLESVAALIEPARVDMQTKFGSVGLLNRGLFVFRDSPKVATNLARLNLAGQILNRAMNILCTREGQALVSTTTTELVQKVDPGLVMRSSKLPPTYEFLSRRRKSRAVKVKTIEEHLPDEAVSPLRQECPEWPEISQAPLLLLNAFPVNIRPLPILLRSTINLSARAAPKSLLFPCMSLSFPEYLIPQRSTMGLIVVSPVVPITEVPPTPLRQSHSNSFEGSDGLQVCEILQPQTWNQRTPEQTNPEVVNWHYNSQNPNYQQQQYQAYSILQPQQMRQTLQQAYQAYSRQPQPQHPADNFISSHIGRRQSDMSLCTSNAALRSRTPMASIQSSTFSEGGRLTGKKRGRAWLEFQSRR